MPVCVLDMRNATAHIVEAFAETTGESFTAHIGAALHQYKTRYFSFLLFDPCFKLESSCCIRTKNVHK